MKVNLKGVIRSDRQTGDLMGGVGVNLPQVYEDRTYTLCDNLFHPALANDLLRFESVKHSRGFVALTITLPEGLLKSYVQILSSLTEFSRFLSYKSKLAKDIASYESPEEILRRNKFRDDYIKQVCSVFDGFIKKGVPVKKAISDTNRFMKGCGHCWAAYSLIYKVLQGQGKLRGFSKELKGGGKHGGFKL